jgi:hypothetical protein
MGILKLPYSFRDGFFRKMRTDAESSMNGEG